jgi:hypothetical protein
MDSLPPSRVETLLEHHTDSSRSCFKTSPIESTNDRNHGVAARDLTIRKRATRNSRALYARHGRELVGCKSPVRKWELLGGQYTKCNQTILSTRRRQLRGGDKPWRGSLRHHGTRWNARNEMSRPSCEATYRNAIEAPRDPEVSCRWSTKPFPTDSKAGTVA